LCRPAWAQEKQPIPGFGQTARDSTVSEGWNPFSDRKLRVGLVGNGFCQFAAAFGFQDHPNVEVVAVSDLIPWLPKTSSALNQLMLAPSP